MKQNNSVARRKRKALAMAMRRHEVSTFKPPRYARVVGRAPGVTKKRRAMARKAREEKRAAA